MILVYIVCANIEEAKRISRHLLEQRLAACTNVHPIASMYWWDGKIVEDNEVALLAKTVPMNFERIKAEVVQLHSYQIPAIFSIPVENVEEQYLRWLEDNVVRIQ